MRKVDNNHSVPDLTILPESDNFLYYSVCWLNFLSVVHKQITTYSEWYAWKFKAGWGYNQWRSVDTAHLIDTAWPIRIPVEANLPRPSHKNSGEGYQIRIGLPQTFFLNWHHSLVRLFWKFHLSPIPFLLGNLWLIYTSVYSQWLSRCWLTVLFFALRSHRSAHTHTHTHNVIFTPGKFALALRHFFSQHYLHQRWENCNSGEISTFCLSLDS